MQKTKMSQCGDCNRVLEDGEKVWNIGQGVWVCEDCFESHVSSDEQYRLEQIKRNTKHKKVGGEQ